MAVSNNENNNPFKNEKIFIFFKEYKKEQRMESNDIDVEFIMRILESKTAMNIQEKLLESLANLNNHKIEYLKRTFSYVDVRRDYNAFLDNEMTYMREHVKLYGVALKWSEKWEDCLEKKK